MTILLLPAVRLLADQVLADALPLGIVLKRELQESNDWAGDAALQLDITLDERRQEEVSSDHLFRILNALADKLGAMGDERRVHVGMLTSPRFAAE